MSGIETKTDDEWGGGRIRRQREREMKMDDQRKRAKWKRIDGKNEEKLRGTDVLFSSTPCLNKENYGAWWKERKGTARKGLPQSE